MILTFEGRPLKKRAG